MLRRWLPVWIIPLVIMFAIGTVWLRLMIIRTTYLIGQTERELEKARQEREIVLIKLTALRSPQRLEHLARTRFGLSQPRVDQVIQLRMGKH